MRSESKQGLCQSGGLEDRYCSRVNPSYYYSLDVFCVSNPEVTTEPIFMKLSEMIDYGLKLCTSVLVFPISASVRADNSSKFFLLTAISRKL